MKMHALLVIAVCAIPMSGCGKVIAGLAKGAGHEADSAVGAAGRAAAHEDAGLASAVAHSADDGIHGPAAASSDEAAARETPVSDFLGDRGKDVAQEVFKSGVENAL